MDNRYFRAYGFALLLILLGSNVNGQSVFRLSPDRNLDSNQDCIELEVNSTVTLERNSDCGPSIIVTSNGGSTINLSSIKQAEDFTFDELGDFVVFCNGTTENSVTALCFTIFDPSLSNLVAADIPTMGEWAIISLFLVMLILGLVALNQKVDNAIEIT
jgi:hypothetical protein